MVLLLMIYCFMYLPLFVGVLCSSLVWYALLYVLSRFAIILTRKIELVALLLLSFGCLVTVNVLWPFLSTELSSFPEIVLIVLRDSSYCTHSIF